MSDRDNSQYKYEEMSNKVLDQDRRHIRRDDATGAPETLRGKLSKSDMGRRVVREEAPSTNNLELQQRRKTKAPTTEDQAFKYSPSTDDTRHVFNLVLAWAMEFLQDVSHSELRDVVDDVLAILHEEDLSDEKMHAQVSELVPGVSPEKFHELLNLSKRLTDYKERVAAHSAEEGAGMAVQFEDEDEYEDQDEDEEDEDEQDEEFGTEALPAVDDRVDIVSEKESKDTENVPAAEIDALWLQRTLSVVKDDGHELQELTDQVYDVLRSDMTTSQAEEQIMELFDYEHLEIVPKLCKDRNRSKVVWLTARDKAEVGPDRDAIDSQIREKGLGWILRELIGGTEENEEKMEVDSKEPTDTDKYQPKEIDLRAMVVEDSTSALGSRVELPAGTTKTTTKLYEEFKVPPPQPVRDRSKRVSIKSMPKWTHDAFPFAELNRIQSAVYPVAFESDENMLVCAPTGAGKTNVALLTILRAISHFRESGGIDLQAFKIVYIAPLKALVQEQVRAFSERLSPYGIKVEELTGDRNMTKQQISETQVIVTTPEKWDVITRKASDVSYTNLVRLVILDEIHLLHDARGPVLESIVSRALRRTEATGELTRLVGLSATLPNYQDVANFLRVDKGLFNFDKSYRPCPLLQKFISVSVSKPSKRRAAMDSACYDKVMEYAGKQQCIIFVHSRKDTARTARFLADEALKNETLDRFLPSTQARGQLKQLAETATSRDLQNLLPMGFAIHHAGMNREDRTAAESAFAEGKIQVLVSTATLAWGVNLPAHTVIIKGTDVYSPERGAWVRLSPQDTLQMLGRAGRPQFDEFGEGIIITKQDDVEFYMSLMNAQLDIESQLATTLADTLNAEIVLGTVTSLTDAVEWLGYTYLYVRMLSDPKRYKVGNVPERDQKMIIKRTDMVHSALMILKRGNLIQYDMTTGAVKSTDMGQISSHFYISHSSMGSYNRKLHPSQSIIDILRVFASSEEFRDIPVRGEEVVELEKLMENAPVPINEQSNEPAAKINVLLQAYISRLKLDGLALMADMVYVTQSAGRLLRAMFELCLKKGWAQMARVMLDLCKMVEQRIWLSNTPLRQFPNCPPDVIKRAEKSSFAWSRYFDLESPAEVGEVVGERRGKLVFDLLQSFPRLGVTANFQPIASDLLRIEVEIKPNFTWDDELHGKSETFTLLVEDSDGEKVLYSDTFMLRSWVAKREHAEYVMDFTVPFEDSAEPNYFVTLVSDRWLHSETRVALSFQKLQLPKPFPKQKMTEIEPKPVDSELQEFFQFGAFNQVQSQSFHSVYQTDESVLVCAAEGNGKTVLAELALLRFWEAAQEKEKAVYIEPFQEQVNQRLAQWQKFQSRKKGPKQVNKLTGELSKDLKLLEQSDLVLATPQQWDTIGRKWARRQNVRRVGLFICDDLNTVGGWNGYIYEVIVLRMKYMAEQLADRGYALRMVGLSTALADASSLGQWIGAGKKFIHNFPPSVRMNPVHIQMQSFSIPHHPSMMVAMAKPAYYSIVDHSGSKLVFVSDRRQCVESAQELVQWSQSRLGEDFKVVDELPMVDRVQDDDLKEALGTGIGILYQGMAENDRKLVWRYFERGDITLLMATRDCCWTAPTADRVVVWGTQLYDGNQYRYVDYPINDLLQMIGCAARSPAGLALILTTNTKRDYYTRFIRDALPIESQLDASLSDAFIPDITERVITKQQDALDWLTYSFYYHRLDKNPSYYGFTSVDDEDAMATQLSTLVEDTLEELKSAEMIDLAAEDEEDEDAATIEPQNGANIAAYYNIAFATMQMFTANLTAASKLRDMLDLVCASQEFEWAISVRTHESATLNRIYERCPFQVGLDRYSYRFKAFVLLQAHISRISLPADLAADQQIVLQKVLQLVTSSVEVLSTYGHLNAIRAMELSQMVVQAVWDRDSPLKQIPFMDDDAVQRAKQGGYVYEQGATLTINRIQTVTDFINIEDDDLRARILGFDDDDRMNIVAEFINTFPVIKLAQQQDDDVVADEDTTVQVTIDQGDDDEEEEYDPEVQCQFYPLPKTKSWWLVVGDASSRELYGIKRVTPSKPAQAFAVSYQVPRAGHYNLTLWCISDSYLTADREVDFEIDVQPPQQDGDGDVVME